MSPWWWWQTHSRENPKLVPGNALRRRPRLSLGLLASAFARFSFHGGILYFLAFFRQRVFIRCEFPIPDRYGIKWDYSYSRFPEGVPTASSSSLPGDLAEQRIHLSFMQVMPPRQSQRGKKNGTGRKNEYVIVQINRSDDITAGIKSSRKYTKKQNEV